MAKQPKKATAKPKAGVQEQPDEQDLLSTRQACEYLGVSRPTLLRLAKKLKWKVYQVYTVNGLENRYQRAALAEYSKRGVKREQLALGGINALQRGQVSTELVSLRQDVQAIRESIDRLAMSIEHLAEIQAQAARENATAVPRLELEQGRPADTGGAAPNEHKSASSITRTSERGLRGFVMHLAGAVQRILEGR